jgi:PAS domain S-box-containing protein
MTKDQPAVDNHIRFALDATETGLWEWDLDTETLIWDETCEQLFGYELGSFPGTYDAFVDRILDADREAVDEQITTAIQTNSEYDVEFRIEQSDGNRRWIRSRGLIETDDAGEPSRMVGTKTDITKERERERKLKNYRKLFENTTDCVVEIERVGGQSLIRQVNAAFEEVFGYTEAEVRDKHIHDVLTPDEYREQAVERREKLLDGAQPVVEVTRKTADGRREFLMRVIKLESRFYVIYTDITERKKHQRSVESARTKLRQIIDLIPDPLYVKNRHDVVQLSNEANAQLHGMTPDEIEGKRERKFEPDVENIKDFDKYRRREREVIETGESTTFEEELTDTDGEEHVFKTTRIPFRTEDSDEDAVLGYARDVTDRKEYEQELEQANAKLEKFAGVVSHDLRNPLNAAQLRLDLVEEDDGEHVASAQQSLDRMEQIIEDVLTLSRAGNTVDDPKQISLADVVRESWDTAKTERAEIEVDLPEHVTITADRARLKHVFENLFRNAVEHNDPRLQIRVGLIESSSPTDDTSASGFFIEDTGRGIPKDEREEIFDHGYSSTDEGTGFGLSIVSDVVDAHNWDISVTESETCGARFEITGVTVSYEW